MRRLMSSLRGTDSSLCRTSSVSSLPPHLALSCAKRRRGTGYSRIVLACFSLHYMPFHPKYCATTYLISELLDAVDGQAARALGQTSKFGAVLDMVTDR